jgi:hypothetical protein
MSCSSSEFVTGLDVFFTHSLGTSVAALLVWALRNTATTASVSQLLWLDWYGSGRAPWGFPLAHSKLCFALLLFVVYVLALSVRMMVALRPLLHDVPGQDLTVINYSAMGIDQTAYDVAHMFLFFELFAYIAWITLFFGMRRLKSALASLVAYLCVQVALLFICAFGVYEVVSVVLGLQILITLYVISVVVHAVVSDVRTSVVLADTLMGDEVVPATGMMSELK